MTKRILHIVVALAMINFLLVPVLALAQTNPGTDLGFEKLGGVKLPRGGNDGTGVVIGLINAVLALVGLVSIIVIIIAGFKYLTSGGNDEKVESARKMLLNGIIGLVLIVAAYAISNFVITKLYEGLNSTSNNNYFR